MWLVAGALLLVSGWLSVVNWVCAVRRFRGRTTSSWIPLVGGALGALGCWIAPDGALRGGWWVPFVVDFGSAPGFVVTGAWLLFRRLR